LLLSLTFENLEASYNVLLLGVTMSVTPESAKTVSLTGEKAGEGPTPKNEFKKPMLTQK